MERDESVLEAFTLGRIEKNGTPEGLLTCESPVCDVRFEQTGMIRMEPRKYCNAKCRQDAWVLKRAAAMLVPLGKQRAWQTLSKVNR